MAACFSHFPLIPSLQRTLADKGLVSATDIQTRVVPLLLAGRSVVGVAQTGSGKTLSYALPALHLLKTLESEGLPVTLESHPRAVILVPTRELGDQVTKVFKTFTHETRLRVRAALGGSALGVARKNVQGCFEILVASPGRLRQLLDQGSLNLKEVQFLVFDEADQMLDPSFLADAKRIAEKCRPECQLGLFSATIPPKVRELIGTLFSTAEFIQGKNSGQLVDTLTTKKCVIKDGVRFPVLEKELAEAVSGGTLIFVNTREQCDKVADQLKGAGKECSIYRGEMDKQVRRANLKAFREGKVRLLVSTDLASRGLDVENVARVINYHLPKTLENYIHRVGRTARAGRKGLVVNLVTERDLPLMRALEAGPVGR